MSYCHRLLRLVSLLLCVGTNLSIFPAAAQVEEDSVQLLQEVSVESYASNRNPIDIPASIGIVRHTDFDRFSSASMLPAFNMLPGVRMEERSPGSYRFSIRGSLLRSPFGVRNVKFYWNGLPLTDGGGNTYLNVLDLFALSKAEVIKGPAGSLYGAGTGGAVLLRSPRVDESGATLTTQYGSFGAIRYGAAVEAASELMDSRIQFVRQESDGYRIQSAMKRSAFNADMDIQLDQTNLMTLTILYTDVYYQTPGGLTETQYETDPKQARPSTATIPGAVEQKAAVYNTTWYSGITFEHQWSNRWTTTLGLVGSNTDFRNPAIRNYETREEQNAGARLTNEYQHYGTGWKGKLTFGGEYQRYSSPIRVTNNVNGDPGNQLISDDKITSDLAMGFVQGEVDLPRNILFTVGASVSYLEYKDQRQVPSPAETNVRKFNPVLAPRVALLKKFSSALSAYVSASKGFSPPSVAEVVPSTGIYNPSLNPETGWSFETGVSGTIARTINVHVAIYDFRLTNTIVLQRDSSGADYFVNAGQTVQRGIELDANWTKNFTSFIQSLSVNVSTAYNDYRFGQYVNDGIDYSGNQVTGVSPFIVALGLDLKSRSGLYLRITGNFVDRLPLNDANTDYASDYVLLGARAGYRVSNKIPIDLYFGIDNILDQRYSLGNDLNAAGKRYYNAAAPLNFYGGLNARLSFKTRE